VGGGPRLHLIVSAFRSIETRRPQLRATNTGISAVVSPTGEIETAAGVHERKVLVATVTPTRRSTLMIAWGDWFGPFACGAAVLLLAILRADPSRGGLAT
jgi:apolipoprotein N-acyltransferase